MSNLMSGGAMTRTSAFSGLQRRLMLRKAGMAASFSTGTSVGERGQVRGPGPSRQRRRMMEQEDVDARLPGRPEHRIGAALHPPPHVGSAPGAQPPSPG